MRGRADSNCFLRSALPSKLIRERHQCVLSPILLALVRTPTPSNPLLSLLTHTVVAFLGWLTILHYGPNSTIYPFFAFDSPTDPYTYRLTATASLVIWATELVSSFFARSVIWMMYRMDVTNVSLSCCGDGGGERGGRGKADKGRLRRLGWMSLGNILNWWWLSFGLLFTC